MEEAITDLLRLRQLQSGRYPDCVMIHRLAEMAEREPGEEHVGSAEPMPRDLRLPSAIPSTQTNERAPIAWATGCVRGKSKSQLIC